MTRARRIGGVSLHFGNAAFALATAASTSAVSPSKQLARTRAGSGIEDGLGSGAAYRATRWPWMKWPTSALSLKACMSSPGR